MIKFEGCGLPNVILMDGYHEWAEDGEIAYSYSDIHGLYFNIGLSIATSQHMLTGQECRFLRKRLELSQEELGAMLGKSAQAVAKWEKGEGMMPRGDAHVLRHAFVHKHFPQELLTFAKRAFTCAFVEEPANAYYFCFAGGQWLPTAKEWAIMAIETGDSAIATALETSKYSGPGVIVIESTS